MANKEKHSEEVLERHGNSDGLFKHLLTCSFWFLYSYMDILLFAY